MPITVSIYGKGQLGPSVATLLSRRSDVTVRGPYGREEREAALRGGADLVVIATTTRLADVADDIEAAVTAGSNVIVSSEESSFPWAIDEEFAVRIDGLARSHNVSVLGGGVNPGFIFDALLLTLLGTVASIPTIDIRRDVNISGFGHTVLRRLGMGFEETEFRERVAAGTILGHAGFPQSMSIVANALGLSIEKIDRVIEPVITPTPIALPHLKVEAGQSAGVEQVYTAWVDGAPWYTATFNGHIDPAGVGMVLKDELTLTPPDAPEQKCILTPGINAQRGSSAMVANSVDRVFAAEPGWVTVADLPPARPVRH